jgi:hypothetical protein
MTTPVALMTGASDGRNAAASWVAVACSMPSTTSALAPLASARRASAAAARSAPTVASAPNRASSARTAGRCLNCSIDGMTLKSGMARSQNGRRNSAILPFCPSTKLRAS